MDRARRLARQRSSITADRGAAPGKPVDTRIEAPLAHLRALESQARSLSFLPRQPARSVLNGRHASKLRGRGLNFEELRAYLPGDDVRAIDWKVTARAGEPHIRVMTEERDRPALIVVDQRMTMFFGSTLHMKSVTAAEAATLAAFRILDQGDRVGGIVFGDTVLAEIRPQRSRAALDRFLKALAEANGLLHAEAPVVEPLTLTAVLRQVASIARRDHLVIVLSDFDRIDAESEQLVAGISRRNDLILVLVTDPLAHDVPPTLDLVVTDGQLQAAIDTADGRVLEPLRKMATGRFKAVLDWQRKHGVPVLPLSAGEETLPQIRRLMGLAGRSERPA